MTPRQPIVTRLGGWPALIAATAVALAASLAVLLWLRPSDDEVLSVDDLLEGGPDPYAVDTAGNVAVGDALPELTLEGLGGADVMSADLEGRIAVLNFWSSSCAPCVREMPLLEEAQSANAGEVLFVGIDVAEGEDPGRKMMERTGVTYPQTRDPSSAVLRLFGGLNLPHTVIVDADGTVTATHSGEIDDLNEMDALLDTAR